MLSDRPAILQFVALLDIWVDDLLTIVNSDHLGKTFVNLRAVCLRGIEPSALQRIDPLVLGIQLGFLPQFEALHVHGYCAPLIWLHHLVRCINDSGRNFLLSIHMSNTTGQPSHTLSTVADKLNVSDMRIYFLPDGQAPLSAARELVLRCLQMCEPATLCKVSVLLDRLITHTLPLVPVLWSSTLKAAQFSVNVGNAVGCQETAQQLAACPLLLDITLDLWNTDLANTHNCERNLNLLLGAVPLACQPINISVTQSRTLRWLADALSDPELFGTGQYSQMHANVLRRIPKPSYAKKGSRLLRDNDPQLLVSLRAGLELQHIRSSRAVVVPVDGDGM